VNLAAEFYLETPKIGMCIILVYFEALNLHQFSIPIYRLFGFESSNIVALIFYIILKWYFQMNLWFYYLFFEISFVITFFFDFEDASR